MPLLLLFQRRETVLRVFYFLANFSSLNPLLLEDGARVPRASGVYEVHLLPLLEVGKQGKDDSDWQGLREG